MTRTASDRVSRSRRDQQGDTDSASDRSPARSGTVAALHAAAGNQAVQSQASATGGGTRSSQNGTGRPERSAEATGSTTTTSGERGDTTSAATVRRKGRRDDVAVVDVRSPAAFRAGHVPGATNVPVSRIDRRADRFRDASEVIAYCRSGRRSRRATRVMRASFEASTRVTDFAGGMRAWRYATESGDRPGKPSGDDGCATCGGERETVGTLVQRLVETGVAQTSLAVSRPSDPAEREAERVAAEVMRTGGPGASAHEEDSASDDERVQRRCSRCQDRYRAGTSPDSAPSDRALETGVTVRRTASSRPGATGSIDGGIERAVQAARSSGAPLPKPVRSQFESKFGRDFGHVRVHTGGSADRAARAINAEAFTIGSDIVFRSGAYRPTSRSGKALLAHELTHVVQQTGHRGGATGGDRDSGSGDSTQAGTVRTSSRPPAIQRWCSGGTWEYEVDGCTNIPDNPTYDFNLLRDSDSAAAHGYRFGSTDEHEDLPCNNHDKCYQTCKSTYRYDEYGSVDWEYNYDWKAHCDEQFRLEMREVCANELYSLEERRDCWDWAETYYDGVDNLGGGAFRERQEGTCKCENEPTSGSPSRGDWNEETRQYNLPAGVRE